MALDDTDKRGMNDVDCCGYIEHRSAMNARRERISRLT